MRALIILFTILFLSFVGFAQGPYSPPIKETVKVDESSYEPCGHFMAKMDALITIFYNSPDSKIYLVYYTGRYRKSRTWNKETKKHDITKLHYPHRDDGLNRAKTIQLYLTTYRSYPEDIRSLLKEQIILLDGGFQEDAFVEIWFGPKGGEPPKVDSLIDEKDIIFRNDRPHPIRDYTTCYSQYH